MTQLVNGVLLGGLYAAIGLGLTLVFGVMKLVNLAHGAMLILSAYLTYTVCSWTGVDPLVALVLVVPAMMVLAYPVQRLVLTPLLLHGPEPPLVATFGVAIIIQAALALIYTSDPRSLTASYASSGTNILGVRVRTVYVVGLVIGVVLVLLTQFALKRLRFGKALRAAAEDPEAAATLGIDVRHVYAMTFALAAGLSAFAGVLVGSAFSITPTSGTVWLALAFTVIVLGGMGSPLGVLLGGIFLGVAEQYGTWLFGPQYRDLVIFSLLLVALVVRPQGLLGRKAT